MSENKISFVLYAEYSRHINLLSDEDAGKLFKAILSFASGDEPEKLEGMAEMAYSFIKAQIERDLQKYEDVCRKRQEAGKLGGRPKKAKKANGFSEKQEETKKPDNEDISDNDNEDISDNEDDKQNKYSSTFEEFWKAYPRKVDKGQAYKKYQARLKDGFSPDELLEAAVNYAKQCAKERTEQKFIKHAKTFLGDSTPFIELTGQKQEVVKMPYDENNPYAGLV